MALHPMAADECKRICGEPVPDGWGGAIQDLNRTPGTGDGIGNHRNASLGQSGGQHQAVLITRYHHDCLVGTGRLSDGLVNSSAANSGNRGGFAGLRHNWREQNQSPELNAAYS